MDDINEKKDERFKDPNEDSIVTSNSLSGKKVDADPAAEDDKPVEDDNLISQESQKGKKVDGDPELETDQPTAE